MATPLRERLPQFPVDSAVPAADQVVGLAATLEAAGFVVHDDGRTKVESDVGLLRLHLVLEDTDGTSHGVIIEPGRYTDEDFDEFWRALVILRSDDRFARSQLLVYCPAPLPPALHYYCGNTRPVLFESAAALLGALEQSPQEAADACVEAVARAGGPGWDYSHGSLMDLDDLVDHAVFEGKPRMLATSLYLLGCYVGQTVVRGMDGSWERDPHLPLQGTVLLAHDRLRLRPFEEVRTLLQEGRSESVYLKVGKLAGEKTKFRKDLVWPKGLPPSVRTPAPASREERS